MHRGCNSAKAAQKGGSAEVQPRSRSAKDARMRCYEVEESESKTLEDALRIVSATRRPIAQDVIEGFTAKSADDRKQPNSAKGRSVAINVMDGFIAGSANNEAHSSSARKGHVTIIDPNHGKRLKEKRVKINVKDTPMKGSAKEIPWRISDKLPKLISGAKEEHPLRTFAKHKVHVLAELFRTSKKADLGAHMVSSKAGDFQEEHERELQRAVDDAEERATRELKAALRRMRDDKEDEKNRALSTQKDYYEKLTRRIEEQRNRAEDERERELTRKFLQQQEEALDRQWKECEAIKQEAIAAACEELKHKLRLEFTIEKDQAVAEALRIAKEKYLIRERNVIDKTRRECEEAAREEAARVAKLHAQDIHRCNQRYDLLEKKWLREIDHRKHVERDFRELQDDYRRFMDYTDGMFHSDYLMQLRHMGQKLAEKQLSTVTYEDLEKEYDLT